MIKLKQILLESPDSVKYEKYNLSYKDNNTYSFGYYKDKFKMLINSLHNDLFTYENENGEEHIIERNDMDFSGRLWNNAKVISFWGIYPTVNELKKIIKDINNYKENKSAVRIDNSWKIDIPDNNNVKFYRNGPSKVITIADYIKNDGIHSVDDRISIDDTTEYVINKLDAIYHKGIALPGEFDYESWKMAIKTAYELIIEKNPSNELEIYDAMHEGWSEIALAFYNDSDKNKKHDYILKMARVPCRKLPVDKILEYKAAINILKKYIEEKLDIYL